MQRNATVPIESLLLKFMPYKSSGFVFFWYQNLRFVSSGLNINCILDMCYFIKVLFEETCVNQNIWPSFYYVESYILVLSFFSKNVQFPPFVRGVQRYIVKSLVNLATCNIIVHPRFFFSMHAFNYNPNNTAAYITSCKFVILTFLPSYIDVRPPPAGNHKYICKTRPEKVHL